MTGPRSTIHDLGYQRYDGERLSTHAAWRALFGQGVRTLFGLGRPARAKAMPVFVLVLSCVPSVIAVFIASQSGQPAPHAAYFASVSTLYILFVAAQTPELFSRDQANRVLPLMLSRDLTRWEYASARLASVVAAMTALALVPQCILWIGGIATAQDAGTELADRWTVLGPMLAVCLLGGALLGSVASVISICTKRRHLATAASVGVFIVLGALAAALGASGTVSAEVVELLNPIGVLGLANRLLFNEPERAITRAFTQPNLQALPVYLVTLAAYIGLCTAGVWWRAERMDT